MNRFKIPKELNKVTPLTKAITVFMFVVLVFSAFMWGMDFERDLAQLDEPNLLVFHPSKPKMAAQTQSADTSTSAWKTYTNAIFSFKYPSNWYVNKYQDSDVAYSLQISDIPNSYTAIQGMNDIHTRIDIYMSIGPVPTSFPYTNGSSANATIRPISINSLKGIRGQESSTAGIEDVVYLENPKGGFVSFHLIPPAKNAAVSKQIFDQFLSTFRFE
jgi:hypothetical protein